MSLSSDWDTCLAPAGGIGTLLGPVVGATVLTWLDDRLIDYADVRLILYGVVLIVLFIGFRRGVVPAVLDQVRRARHDTTPRPPDSRG